VLTDALGASAGGDAESPPQAESSELSAIAKKPSHVRIRKVVIATPGKVGAAMLTAEGVKWC